jgi:hypothetical protein
VAAENLDMDGRADTMAGKTMVIDSESYPIVAAAMKEGAHACSCPAVYARDCDSQSPDGRGRLEQP